VRGQGSAILIKPREDASLAPTSPGLTGWQPAARAARNPDLSDLMQYSAMPVRTVTERGPKDKRSVAFAIDWPGWSRGAKTAELALETLESYRERYPG